MKRDPCDGRKPGGRAYHHGDLANALLSAATELAREGGPQAVVLREAARRVGVSPTAAYRHFGSHTEIVNAVKDRALDVLATTMAAEISAGKPLEDPLEDVLRRLRAMGTGYLRFASGEPGLFRTVFASATANLDAEAEPLEQISEEAFQMLRRTLDEISDLGGLVGVLPYTEIAVWSTIHGLACLLLDGPLGRLPEIERQQAIETTLNFIVTALLQHTP